MSDQEKKPKDLECKPELEAFERNNYFYGKLLTVRDFEAEQSYFMGKQRLINRLLHGAGVVCGLEVKLIDNKQLTVDPGIALDCCGREIVVPETYKRDLSSEEIKFVQDGRAYVILKYDFCGGEKTPSVSDASSCEETCCYSRIRETYTIEINEVEPKECASCVSEGFCENWEGYLKNPEGSEKFLKEWQNCPPIPPDPVVLLAIIQKDANTIRVENTARTLVFSNPHLYELIKCLHKQMVPVQKIDLPHIDEINWKHDREYDFFDDEQMKEFRKIVHKFIIKFSKDMDGTTINHNTLDVTGTAYVFKEFEKFGYVEKPLTKTEFPVYFYPEDENNKKLVSFTIIPPRTIPPKFTNLGLIEIMAENLIKYTANQAIAASYSSKVVQPKVKLQKVGFRLHIQLKGDFILDKKENPLDANHLKGERPTGNGTPGGLFESWFDIKLDWSKVEQTNKEIKGKPGIKASDISKNIKISRETIRPILDALVENKVISYNEKEEKYSPLPNPANALIVYDEKYPHLKESADKLREGLKDKGILAEIKSTDDLTDEDKNNNELILLRGEEVKEATNEKLSEVKSKLDWKESKGDTEIVKNPYIKDANLFLVGGKDKSSIVNAVNKFLGNYKGK